MKKKWMIGIAGLMGVLVLAGAAYLGAQLLNQRSVGMSLFGSGPGNITFKGNGAGGPVRKELKANVKNAEEIPARKGDVMGIITAIGDNTITVGANPEFSVTDVGGEPEVNVEARGPKTEVVMTNETKVYVETTFEGRDISDMPEDGEEIQQTVEAMDASELAPENTVTVWGYKRGDRVVAEVILYSKPVMFRKGGK